MRIGDVMTKDPVTVGPEALLKDVARLLDEHGISGVPVVGIGGVPLGVVSEADILSKEAGADPDTRRRLGRLFGNAPDVEARAKLAARTAGESMSAPAMTARPEQSVAEAARTMIERGVNRLPVVDQSGSVVGIVTRADLVRAFTRPDDEIRREVEQDVILGSLWTPPGRVSVTVKNGEVTVEGRLETKLDAELLPRLVERVPGVVSVVANLSWDQANAKASR